MIFLVILLLLLIAGAIYEASAARLDRARYPPPGRLVDAGGVALHLYCTGTGTPVVVLDAGLGDSSLVWVSVQEPVSLHTRVCSYDRAGLAWSEPGPVPRSAERTVAELHELLINAGEKPPYILVGHSAGVNHVRLFAHTYPDAVAGLILVEPPLLTQASPGLVMALTTIRRAIGAFARVGGVRLLGKLRLLRLLFGGVSPPPELAERAGLLYSPPSIRASIQETQALPETIRQVNAAATPHAWNNWPVTLIAAHAGAHPSDELMAALQALANLSTQGRVITIQSSHFVHFEHPAAVVRAIQEMVQAVHDQ